MRIILLAFMAAVLLAASFVPCALSAESKNMTNLDRYGSPATVDVDRYGDKAVYDIEKYSNTRPVYDVSRYSQIKPLYDVSRYSQIKPVFNVSQRGGMRSTYGYQYAISAQPIWTQPVHNTSGYSTSLPVMSIGQTALAGQVSSRVGGSSSQAKPVRVGASKNQQF